MGVLRENLYHNCQSLRIDFMTSILLFSSELNIIEHKELHWATYVLGLILVHFADFYFSCAIVYI